MTSTTTRNPCASSSAAPTSRSLRAAHHCSARISLMAAALMLLGASTLGYAQDVKAAAAHPKAPVHIMRKVANLPYSKLLRAPFSQRAMARPELTPVNTGTGIVFTCDSNVATATCNYLNTTVAGWYNDTFTNANASIYIMYGSTGLAQSTTGFYNFVTYDQYVAALTSNSSPSAVQTSALSALGTYDATPYGSDYISLTGALGTTLGFSMTGTTLASEPCSLPGTGCYNGIITVTNDGGTPLYYDNLGGSEPGDAYDFYGVVAHETDEVLGTASCIDTQNESGLVDDCDGAAPSGGPGTPSAVDLYRYSSPGQLALDSALSTTPGAYFSYNGGSENGAKGKAGTPKVYNTLDNGDDYADFLSSSPDCGTDIAVQDAEGCPGEDAGLSILNDGGGEINILEAVGYSVPATTTAGSSTVLKAAPTGITASQSTELTATVTGVQSDVDEKIVSTPTGSITFWAGSTNLGSCTLSSGTCKRSVAGSALQSGPNSVTANYSGDPNYSSSVSNSVTVTVTSSTLAPHVHLSESVIHFGNQKLGTASAWREQTLTNNGKATLHFHNIGMTGKDISSFPSKNNCGSTLAVGAHCTIHEEFDPAKAGKLTAAVTFTDDADFDPQYIWLTGTGESK